MCCVSAKTVSTHASYMIIHLDVVMRIRPPCTWQFGHSCVYTTVDWKQQSALMHPPTNTLKPCRPVSFRGFSAQPCFSDRSSLISLLCLLPFLGSFSPPHLLVGYFFFNTLRKIDLAFEYILSYIDRAWVFFGIFKTLLLWGALGELYCRSPIGSRSAEYVGQ